MKRWVDEEAAHEAWVKQELAEMKREFCLVEHMFNELLIQKALYEWEKYQELKKYNPSQPRAPRGSSTGGQWIAVGSGSGSAPRRREAEREKPKPAAKPKPVATIDVPKNPKPELVQVAESGQIMTDGIVDDSGITRVEVPIRVPKNQRKLPEIGEVIQVPSPDGIVPDKVNIFIGGALDKDDHGNVGKSDALNYDIYGVNYYYTHDEAKKVGELLDELNNEGTEVNLVGHSLGGGTAVQVALAKRNKVNNLITVDPVGPINVGRDPKTKVSILEFPDYDKVKGSTNNWININSVGKPGRTSAGDVSAGFGRSWDDKPKGKADLYIEAPLIHEDFDGMLNTKPVAGNSAREILNHRK